MLSRNCTEIVPKLYGNCAEIPDKKEFFYTSHRAEIFIIIYAFEITLLDYYHRIMVAVFYR